MSPNFYLTEKNSKLFQTTISILLLAGVVCSQYYFDLEKRSRPSIPPTTIPAQAIKISNLGLHSVSSAIIWLYAIQQLLDHPNKVPELIKITNELDPKFSYPYAFAALVLPAFNFTDQAIEIAKKGVADARSDWRIPYYLATTYHIFLQDRKNAALYFSIAADTPDVPENIKFLAASYGTSQYLEQTKQIWLSIFETSDDEFVIEKAKNHIIHIEVLEFLEKAVSLYRQKYGIYPSNMSELINKKVIKETPHSPLGVSFEIGKGGKIIIE
ncbi:MAG: hypothetical protein Q8Q89_00090 [bacterium]|nr:hypothetical protein [bacterium]